MPRGPRIDIPGLIYHVTSRGVKRMPLFHEDADRHQFLRLLSLAREKVSFRLHAYCLMTNHYHLLLQTLDSSLSKIMHWIKKPYAAWFNRKYGLSGHLFQGRFHSLPVQEDRYFTTVCRYIHLNPVRAGIVAQPEHYPWSNYRRLLRGEADAWVDPTFLLDYFGGDTAVQREKYRRFVQEGMDKTELITERLLYRMRFWGAPPLRLPSNLSQKLQ